MEPDALFFIKYMFSILVQTFIFWFFILCFFIGVRTAQSFEYIYK